MVSTPKVETTPPASKRAGKQNGRTKAEPAAQTAGPAPATHQPLTPEELADRLRPEDPRISPDGRAVVFAVAPRGKKGEHKSQGLWISRDGAPARPLTAGTAHDANPRWSPDGTRLLFCSDRAERGDESFKLYLLAADGGEAQPLGDLQGSLTMPSWSPDGRSPSCTKIR